MLKVNFASKVKKTKSRLQAKTVSPGTLTELDQARMYRIMLKYYDSMTKEQFKKDLAAKHAVIILRDADGRIQGFSTLLKRQMQHEGRSVIALFSGDTIIEKQYWGQKVLGVEFLRYLWLEQIKSPFKPVYWFLISKGYKTYLLMANNFGEYYPRYEKSTPESFKTLMNDFYSSLYPEKYSSSEGLIKFEVCEGKLKEGVADIGVDLLMTNARVAFFNRANPNWKAGEELACVARMTLLMPLKYQFKVLFKRRNSGTKKLPVFSPAYSGQERRQENVFILADRRRGKMA